jgi:cobalamin biosynthesis protein CobD/CbiB
LKLDYRSAARIYFRDRLCYSRPNAGHTEAAVAGAPEILQGGQSVYLGKVVAKPFSGKKNRDIVSITPIHQKQIKQYINKKSYFINHLVRTREINYWRK